jgi:hypothetical protein
LNYRSLTLNRLTGWAALLSELILSVDNSVVLASHELFKTLSKVIMQGAMGQGVTKKEGMKV